MSITREMCLKGAVVQAKRDILRIRGETIATVESVEIANMTNRIFQQNRESNPVFARVPAFIFDMEEVEDTLRALDTRYLGTRVSSEDLDHRERDNIASSSSSVWDVTLLN